MNWNDISWRTRWIGMGLFAVIVFGAAIAIGTSNASEGDQDELSGLDEYRTRQAAGDGPAADASAPTRTPAPSRQVSHATEKCTTASGAEGTVTNHGDEPLDIYVRATFHDEAGTQIGDGIDAVRGLAAGETAIWNAAYYDRNGTVEECRVRISNVFYVD